MQSSLERPNDDDESITNSNQYNDKRKRNNSHCI